MRTTASGEITATHVSSALDCGAVCSGSHPPLAVVVVVRPKAPRTFCSVRICLNRFCDALSVAQAVLRRLF
jgi:hypothetical protein